MKKVLFVCVENSCRSQIAEAYGKLLGGDTIDVFSSGSRPSGNVNKKAIASMNEVGHDLTKHSSKSLDDIPQITYDYVITMGCGDECPYVQAKKREDWNIPDPKNMEMDEFNKLRDTIEENVTRLIKEIKSANNSD